MSRNDSRLLPAEVLVFFVRVPTEGWVGPSTHLFVLSRYVCEGHLPSGGGLYGEIRRWGPPFLRQ